MSCFRPLFKSYGSNFIFDPNGYYSYRTISVGDHVFIGNGAFFSSPLSTITIGSYVMFGANVMILGGDHNTAVIGKFMSQIREKKPGDDLPVTIENDVWIGAGSIILKGVNVGRGSIVAAGSVVVKNVKPYAIFGGVPAKFIQMRFDAQTIERHEALVYQNVGDS